MRAPLTSQGWARQETDVPSVPWSKDCIHAGATGLPGAQYCTRCGTQGLVGVEQAGWPGDKCGQGNTERAGPTCDRCNRGGTRAATLAAAAHRVQEGGCCVLGLRGLSEVIQKLNSASFRVRQKTFQSRWGGGVPSMGISSCDHPEAMGTPEQQGGCRRPKGQPELRGKHLGGPQSHQQGTAVSEKGGW